MLAVRVTSGSHPQAERLARPSNHLPYADDLLLS